MPKGKAKYQNSYMVDNNLLPRVRMVLATIDEDDMPGGSVDTTMVCDLLKSKFKEYQRKPAAALLQSVDRALGIIMSEPGAPGSETIVQIVDEADDDVSFYTSPPAKTESEDGNKLNKSLLSMYKAAPQTPPNDKMDTTTTTTTTPKTPSSVLKSSGGVDNNNNSINNNNNNNNNSNNNNNNAPKKPETSQKKRGSLDSSTSGTNSTPTTPLSSQQPKKKLKSGFESTVDKQGNMNVTANIVSAIPTVKYADVGGIEAIIQTIRETIEQPLLHPEIYKHLGVLPPRGVLLCGPPGCGKTLLANAIAGELEVPFISISAPEVVSGMSGESEAKIRTLFTDAMAQAPALIFIDEIDAITPKRENAQREMEKRIVAQLLTSMDLLEYNPKGTVIVIGATNRPESLDPALRRAGRFDKEITMGIPDTAARCKILQVLSQKMKLEGDFDFMAIAEKTPGFVGADLTALTKEAAVIAINRIFSALDSITANGGVDEIMNANGHVNGSSDEEAAKPSEERTPMQLDALNKAADLARRSAASDRLRAHVGPLSDEQMAPLCITMADFTAAIKKVQPSAKREGFATIPNVTWNDIGALKAVRHELALNILQPIKQPDRYKNMGLNPSAGVLMYGPPGCGKTLLAKAIANECHANFISVKGPELLNKYVGESERAVRQVFQRASSSAPCIIFFDELDALAPRRNGDDNESSKRVVNMLLTEMDGLEKRNEVFVVAATNRPDMIDPAMLRPGRLDKCLCVSLPEAADRVDILRTITHSTPLDNTVDFEKIGNDPRCDGYSGADLAALVKEAAIYALSIAPETQIRVTVSQAHFEHALTKIFPSVSKKDAILYQNLRRSLPGGNN